MKLCENCKLLKHSQSFIKNLGTQVNSNPTKSTVCKECRDTTRAYDRAYYHKNPERKRKVIARAIKTNKSLKEIGRKMIIEFKDKPCMDCKQKFPYYVMDTDHIGKEKKQFTISHWTLGHLDLKALEKELQKCEVVCANCHRIRTHNRAVETARIELASQG